MQHLLHEVLIMVTFIQSSSNENIYTIASKRKLKNKNKNKLVDGSIFKKRLREEVYRHRLLSPIR